MHTPTLPPSFQKRLKLQEKIFQRLDQVLSADELDIKAFAALTRGHSLLFGPPRSDPSFEVPEITPEQVLANASEVYGLDLPANYGREREPENQRKREQRRREREAAEAQQQKAPRSIIESVAIHSRHENEENLDADSGASAAPAPRNQSGEYAAMDPILNNDHAQNPISSNSNDRSAKPP